MKKIFIYTGFVVIAFILSGVFLGKKTEPLPDSKLEIVKEKNSLPTRRQLRSALFQKKEILIIYGAENPEILKKYEGLKASFNEHPLEYYGQKFTVRFKNVVSIEVADLESNALFLVGTTKANPFIKKMSGQIPVSFSDTAIILNDKKYGVESDVLSVGPFPNPKNLQLPLSFMAANDEAELYYSFENRLKKGARFFFRQTMDYEIHRNNTRIVLGNFNREWKFDEAVHFDYSEGNELIYSSEHYDFISHQNAISKEEAIHLAELTEKSTKELINFVGISSIPKMNYHIYNTAENKGLMVANTEQAHSHQESNSVHTIVNSKYANNYIQKEQELIILKTIGESLNKVLTRGLSVVFTKQWQREGYRYWSAHLHQSKNSLSIQELLDNELVEKESSLIVDCMAGSFVQFLIKKWGREQFLKNYANWNPNQKKIDQLEKEWNRYLSNQASLVQLKSRKKQPLNYLKGFNFAHEGYNIYNGYLSQKATAAIQKQKDLGANTIAIVPYSSISREGVPSFIRIGAGAGGENDQGIVHSVYEARKLGMSSVLKPQLYFRGSWPGAVNYQTKEGWNAFFNYYYRWIRHYAFLAEIHQIEVMCMGVEFKIATLTHEEEWRRMFQNIRGLYQGQLTYAANWGEEFEQVGFWDELDFIGINSYYPLSKKDDPTDKELKTSFEEVKMKIRKVSKKFKKPVVFTEIGFRSIDTPWKNPHADGNTPFNEDAQNRCYEVIFEGIDKEPWCQGILWWKFPSYLEYRGTENNAFTPNGKKAEVTIKKWFSKM